MRRTPSGSYAGLSDASAVPETPGAAGWEPAIVVNYPVEPSLLDDSEPEAGEVAIGRGG